VREEGMQKGKMVSVIVEGEGVRNEVVVVIGAVNGGMG
jgi:hypothetical protein